MMKVTTPSGPVSSPSPWARSDLCPLAGYLLLLVWLTQLTAMKLRSSCKGGALCMGSKIVRNA